jgi:RHS repeat-associated protein
MDGEGKPVWSVEYDIYGKIRKQNTGNDKDCPFRYPGQYEDSETGLYYNRFRYYAPEEGIYVSQDPIRLKSEEFNLYAYAGNPNNTTDAYGLAPAGYTFDFPKDPQDLINEGWKDVTHPDKAANTNMIDLNNPATGQTVEFHPGTSGQPGWEGKDHYHAHNPSSTGKGDLYLDKDGNPVPKGSNASHIPPCR